MKSYFRIWILVPHQGAGLLQPAGVLKYAEDLQQGRNAEGAPKDFSEMAST